MTERTPRLAVLGSPISHSRSPAIHRAAYRALGLDWRYAAIEVGSGHLGGFLAELGPQWRGLSLTMPLKREVLPLLSWQDTMVDLVGAANTVLFEHGAVRGFNTDVYGAERMVRESVRGPLTSALILGAGATACSVAVALASCGVRRIVAATRSPEKSSALEEVARGLSVALTVRDLSLDPGVPDVVVSTLPGTAPLAREFPAHLRRTVPLVDVAYDPWPTPLAAHWLEVAGQAPRAGLAMLLYQALGQVRAFVTGSCRTPLPQEPAVLAAMRQAVFGQP